MRYLLLILLIATFPLRGFASAGMQTGMGLMTLHQASMTTAMTATQPAVDKPAMPQTQIATTDTAEASATHTCCAQCSSCDVCHLLVGQPAALITGALLATPASPEARNRHFASADAQHDHKPPRALI
ncbi:MAG: hypothetical protein ACKVIH_08740 [Burkholderiales bacterium]